VEARDPYTEGHCERLAKNAADMGRFLGLDEESIVALGRGGYLHDLGKIAVPDEILKKGSDLTPAEWDIMKRHPATGEAICRPLKSLRLVLPIIRHHHEHSDGSGYPMDCMPARFPCCHEFYRWSISMMRCVRRVRINRRWGTSRLRLRCAPRRKMGCGRGVGREFFGMLDKRRQWRRSLSQWMTSLRDSFAASIVQ